MLIIGLAICDLTSILPNSSRDAFFRKMGSKFTSIQINTSTYDYDAESLSRIVAFCTNLTRVDWVFFQWLTSFFTVPKSVHTLGIRINGRRQTPSGDILLILTQSPI